MALYITLANYTDQGIRNLKETPDRLGAARRAIEAAGGGAGAGIRTLDLLLGKETLYH